MLRTQTCVNWSGPIAMVPCLHQGKICIKRKITVWRDQKCIRLASKKIPLTCAGRQTTPSQRRRYSSENGNLRKFGLNYRHGTVFTPKQYLYQKEATGMERSEMYFPTRCKKKLLFVRAVKPPRLKGVGIVQRTETCVKTGGSITIVPCLYQGNIYIKRKLWVWKDQKCLPLVGGKTPLTCAGRQSTPSQGCQYKRENGNLCKLGWTYRHGTVFAPKQHLYQKEATGMERPEMYFPSQCENPSCAGCPPTPSQWSRYSPENKNLHKFGWSFCHDTMFQPRRFLYKKEATGMERPEMYSPSRCKDPSYLCGPSNYPVSRESV